MSYCVRCGEAVAEDAAFCGSCGAPVAAKSPTAGTPEETASAIRTASFETKRGGILALKGVLLTLGLGVIGNMTLISTHHGQGGTEIWGIWRSLGFVIGAAYIIVSLSRWRRHGHKVKGEALAWVVAFILAVSVLGGLDAAGIGELSGTTAGGASTSVPTPELSPHDILMRDVKLDFAWDKQGFGTVMVANFTVHNPTKYAFKDFTIACTHFARSGTAIDSNTRTVYDIVRPHSTKHIENFNMGFIAAQAASSSCRIADFTTIP